MFDLLRFVVASQILRKELMSSPLWPMLMNEPVIVEWMESLKQIEVETERIKNETQTNQLPENQSQR